MCDGASGIPSGTMRCIYITNVNKLACCMHQVFHVAAKEQP